VAEKDLLARRRFLDFLPRKIKILPQPIKPTLLRKMVLTWKILSKPYKLGQHKT
jgi:hypothetical protein